MNAPSSVMLPAAAIVKRPALVMSTVPPRLAAKVSTVLLMFTMPAVRSRPSPELKITGLANVVVVPTAPAVWVRLPTVTAANETVPEVPAAKVKRSVASVAPVKAGKVKLAAPDTVIDTTSSAALVVMAATSRLVPVGELMKMSLPLAVRVSVPATETSRAPAPVAPISPLAVKTTLPAVAVVITVTGEPSPLMAPALATRVTVALPTEMALSASVMSPLVTVSLKLLAVRATPLPAISTSVLSPAKAILSAPATSMLWLAVAFETENMKLVMTPAFSIISIAPEVVLVTVNVPVPPVSPNVMAAADAPTPLAAVNVMFPVLTMCVADSPKAVMAVFAVSVTLAVPTSMSEASASSIPPSLTVSAKLASTVLLSSSTSPDAILMTVPLPVKLAMVPATSTKLWVLFVESIVISKVSKPWSVNSIMSINPPVAVNLRVLPTPSPSNWIALPEAPITTACRVTFPVDVISAALSASAVVILVNAMSVTSPLPESIASSSRLIFSSVTVSLKLLLVRLMSFVAISTPEPSPANLMAPAPSVVRSRRWLAAASDTLNIKFVISPAFSIISIAPEVELVTVNVPAPPASPNVMALAAAPTPLTEVNVMFPVVTICVKVSPVDVMSSADVSVTLPVPTSMAAVALSVIIIPPSLTVRAKLALVALPSRSTSPSPIVISEPSPVKLAMVPPPPVSAKLWAWFAATIVISKASKEAEPNSMISINPVVAVSLRVPEPPPANSIADPAAPITVAFRVTLPVEVISAVPSAAAVMAPTASSVTSPTPVMVMAPIATLPLSSTKKPPVPAVPDRVVALVLMRLASVPTDCPAAVEPLRVIVAPVIKWSAEVSSIDPWVEVMVTFADVVASTFSIVTLP